MLRNDNCIHIKQSEGITRPGHSVNSGSLYRLYGLDMAV